MSTQYPMPRAIGRGIVLSYIAPQVVIVLAVVGLHYTKLLHVWQNRGQGLLFIGLLPVIGVLMGRLLVWRKTRVLRHRVEECRGAVCTECGYDLRSLSEQGVCPECGKHFRTSDLSEHWQAWGYRCGAGNPLPTESQ